MSNESVTGDEVREVDRDQMTQELDHDIEGIEEVVSKVVI